MNAVLLQVVFWLSLLYLIYIYAGYPVILAILSVSSKKVVKNEKQTDDILPLITIFIAVHNESSVIQEKLENALSLDYPSELLEIIVASDGSNDGTNEILSKYQDKGIEIFINNENHGKNSVINQYAPFSKGHILIFTDANAIFSRNALRLLAHHFSDPKVGCVGGKLKYLKGDGLVAKGEGIYFRYENILRKFEGKLGSMVGANGAIYAIRKDLFVDIPHHVPNDFYHPLTVLRRGLAVEFEDKAMAFEKPTTHRGEEFRRRSRIVMRSIGAVMEVKQRYGSLHGMGLFNLLSHKILRWFAFPVFIILFIVNIPLIGQPFYSITMFSLGLLVLLGLAGYVFDRFGVRVKFCSTPYYFMLINVAAMHGMLKYFRGKRVSTWKQAQTTR